jgi:predicted NBD/HSP70 family sugar kinase
VFVENDAAAAAMGEMQLGLGQKNNSFFYILISSGLGGGMVIDGTYFRGADGRSGELGFMHAREGGEQIQRLVSLSGLARSLVARGLSLDNIMRGETSAAEEDCLADWIERAAQQLMVPLEAVNCLINPSVVLLGGRLPTQPLERLAARINELMHARAAVLPSVAPIARAALSEDAPAVGAAILPFSHFLLPKPGALWKAGAGADAQAVPA